VLSEISWEIPAEGILMFKSVVNYYQEYNLNMKEHIFPTCYYFYLLLFLLVIILFHLLLFTIYSSKCNDYFLRLFFYFMLEERYKISFVRSIINLSISNVKRLMRENDRQRMITFTTSST